MTKVGHGVGVADRRLNNNAHAAAGKHQIKRGKNAERDRDHKAAVGRKLLAEQSEQSKVEKFRSLVVLRIASPEELHELLNEEGEPEGKDELGDMPIGVYPPKTVALDACANGSDEQGGNE